MLNIDTPTLISWMAALAAVASLVAVALPFIFKENTTKRLKNVTRQRETLSHQQVEQLNAKGSSIRQRKSRIRTEVMKKILHVLKLDEALSSKTLKMRLAQAGFRSQNALISYTFTRFAMGAGLFALSVALFTMWKDFSYPLSVKILIMAGTTLIGFYMPKIYVGNIAQKRQKSLNLGFADALDLMVICVEGGLSVEGAFDRVTQEIAKNFPDLAQEFALTSAELSYLGDRHQAFLNFSERTGLPAAKSLATTLIQSEKYGTPVGQALKVLSQERRLERMAIAEKKGASLPAKLTVPMILFFLPPLFMVVIGPAAINIMNR